MKKRRRKSAKATRFVSMRAEELAEATARYGKELVVDEFKSPDIGSRRRWQRARRKPGRPRRGKGARVISVSVERGLLSRSDSLAQNLGLTRAGLIERGLKAVLLAENADYQIALDRWRDKDDLAVSSAELRRRFALGRRRFLELADQLASSTDASEQKRLKRELARITYGE